MLDDELKKTDTSSSEDVKDDDAKIADDMLGELESLMSAAKSSKPKSSRYNSPQAK